MNVLEGIRYSGRKNDIKFYQASSSEMFGKSYDTDPNSGPIGKMARYQDENTAFMPQSPYAIAKLAAHHLVRNYRDAYGIFGCSGILFNHESERRGEKFVTRKITKWIGEFSAWMDFHNVTSEKLATVDEDEVYIPGRTDRSQDFQFPKLKLGNLDAKRDWGHAQDYVNAMWLMMQRDKPDDYVVATGKTHAVREFLDIAFNFIGVDDWEKFVGIDPKFYRPAEVDYLLGRPEKSHKVLGWELHVSFQELVERMTESDINEARLRRLSLQTV